MITVGLLGAPASGKSLVAAELAALGAFVFDADASVHELLKDPIVQDGIVAVLGREVLNEHGIPSRKAIAELVFGADDLARERLKFLERLLHPLVLERCQKQRVEQAQRGVALFVIDAPLLLEAGWSTLCERLIYIDAPAEVRYHRAMARGWSPREVEARASRQVSPKLKRVRADFVIDNSCGVDELRRQVREVWQALLLLESEKQPGPNSIGEKSPSFSDPAGL